MRANDIPPDTRRRRSTSLSNNNVRLPPPPPPSASPTAPVFERFHSFKDFIALQKDSLEPERAVQLYAQYQLDFKVQSAKSQLDQNMSLGYVRERFHPDNVIVSAQQKAMRAQRTAKFMIENIRNNGYQDLALQINISDPQSFLNLIKKDQSIPDGRVVGYLEDIDKFKTDVENVTGRLTDSPFYAVNLNEGGRTLILKKLPYDVQRRDLEELVSEVEGVISISLFPSCLISENYSKLMICAGECSEIADISPDSLDQVISECYTRLRGPYGALYPLQTAWIEFDSRENCEKAELAIEKAPIRDLCTAHPMKVVEHPAVMRKVRICSFDASNIRAKDYVLLSRLIVKLDREFNVHEHTKTSGIVPMEIIADVPPAEGASTAPEPMSIVDAQASQPSVQVKVAEDESETGDSNEVKASDDEEQDKNQTLLNMAVDNPFLKTIENISSTTLKLDLMILYLRAVHAMDFYSGVICWNPRELFETCGALTIRLNQTNDLVVVPDELLLNNAAEKAFRKRLSMILSTDFTHWMHPIDEEHPIFLDLWTRFCSEKTVPVDTEKYRCAICKKAFKGSEFVHKHLKNKHSVDEAEPLKQQARSIMMRRAFDNDDAKLLLFAIPITFEFAGRSLFRASGGPNVKSPSEFGPQRRGRLSGSSRSNPMSSQRSPQERQYRDWDAPRSRLQDRFGAGTFRALIHYNDL